jgi:hypothetical protein
MEELGFASSSSKPAETGYLLNPFRGSILRFCR